jgi:hypothetical protein
VYQFERVYVNVQGRHGWSWEKCKIFHVILELSI